MGAGVIMAFVIIDPMARAMIFTTIALGIVRAPGYSLKKSGKYGPGLGGLLCHEWARPYALYLR